MIDRSSSGVGYNLGVPKGLSLSHRLFGLVTVTVTLLFFSTFLDGNPNALKPVGLGLFGVTRQVDISMTVARPPETISSDSKYISLRNRVARLLETTMSAGLGYSTKKAAANSFVNPQ